MSSSTHEAGDTVSGHKQQQEFSAPSDPSQQLSSSSPHNGKTSKPSLNSDPTQRFTNITVKLDEKKSVGSTDGGLPQRGSILRKGKKDEEGAEHHPDVKVSFSNPTFSHRDSDSDSDSNIDVEIPHVLSDLTIGSNRNGSLTSDRKTKEADPETLMTEEETRIYNLNDVLESTKEGPDEAAVLSSLERRRSSKHQFTSPNTHENMLPRVPDELLLNLHESDREKQEDSDDDSNNDSALAPPQQKNVVHGDSDDLRILAHRLAEMPLLAGNMGGSDGGGDTEPSRQHLLQKQSGASQGDDSKISRDANSNENIDNGSVKLARAGVDRYHNNSALIFPTKRRSSASARMSDPDIELAGVDDYKNDDDDDPSSKKKRKPKRSTLQRILEARRRAKVDFDFFMEFMEPHKPMIWKRFWQVTWRVMVPSLVLASVLFYGLDNPPVGYALTPCNDYSVTATEPESLFPNLSDRLSIAPRPVIVTSLAPTATNETYAPTISQAPSAVPTRAPTFSIFERDIPLCIDEEMSLEKASASWWILFLGCRQAVMLSVATFLQLLIIDFLTLRTRVFPKVLGTQMSLAIAQSKGWPFVLFMLALLDLMFLFGDRRIARHWLFWQKFISLMNATNPSGNVTDAHFYKLIIYISLALSVAVTLKRTLMGNFVGNRVVVNYREDLSKIIKKCLLISEVAALASFPQRIARRNIVQKYDSFGKMYVKPLGKGSSSDEYSSDSDGDDDVSKVATQFMNTLPFGRSVNSRNPAFTGSFEADILEMLDEWEEPELSHEDTKTVKTTDVLFFRRALGFIDNEYPFSPAFGRASTREECINSSQKIFEKLKTGRRQVLNFTALCEITKSDDGTLDKTKIRDLIKVFRPNRVGEISKIDFVRSVDSVYKQLRLLLANIRNSSQIDNAYERIVSCVFYVIVGFVILAAFGFDINSIFLLLSSILVSFAFMIGSASSKYMEGILLILVRKPYNIGDRVAFLDPNSTVDTKGPPAGGWVVERVDLYTTTVRLGTTREYATFTNGSLANSKIINMKRSDKPNIFMHLKFTSNVTRKQLEEFKIGMTKFIKDRPREWIRINGFRCTRVETEQQFLEYLLIVQHRESWQSFSAIQDSQGDVFIHALHLQKELGMEYIAPKVPIEMLGGEHPSREPAAVFQPI
ncbi:mechanosensitive ion channel [Nitzschia inconspicua]|uniref:Mechanosensitive ion channel n=1 Tax=Nitzschia inconspicua TaxID=303405 RepID=A0A9K3Q000_9STRA|nr:mechanosensitive ion channel [Nitzschia inconspicua]